MSYWTRRTRGNQLGGAFAVVFAALALALPASALEIGDMFDWLVADGGDGGSSRAATELDIAATEDLVVQTTFLPDTLPPVVEDEGAARDADTTEATPATEIAVEMERHLVEVDAPRDLDAAPVPEPSAALLFGLGAVTISQTLRRRR